MSRNPIVAKNDDGTFTIEVNGMCQVAADEESAIAVACRVLDARSKIDVFERELVKRRGRKVSKPADCCMYSQCFQKSTQGDYGIRFCDVHWKNYQKILRSRV